MERATPQPLRRLRGDHVRRLGESMPTGSRSTSRRRRPSSGMVRSAPPGCAIPMRRRPRCTTSSSCHGPAVGVPRHPGARGRIGIALNLTPGLPAAPSDHSRCGRPRRRARRLFLRPRPVGRYPDDALGPSPGQLPADRRVPRAAARATSRDHAPRDLPGRAVVRITGVDASATSRSDPTSEVDVAAELPGGARRPVPCGCSADCPAIPARHLRERDRNAGSADRRPVAHSVSHDSRAGGRSTHAVSARRIWTCGASRRVPSWMPRHCAASPCHRVRCEASRPRWPWPSASMVLD